MISGTIKQLLASLKSTVFSSFEQIVKNIAVLCRICFQTITKMVYLQIKFPHNEIQTNTSKTKWRSLDG